MPRLSDQAAYLWNRVLQIATEVVRPESRRELLGLASGFGGKPFPETELTELQAIADEYWEEVIGTMPKRFSEGEIFLAKREVWESVCRPPTTSFSERMQQMWFSELKRCAEYVLASHDAAIRFGSLVPKAVVGSHDIAEPITCAAEPVSPLVSDSSWGATTASIDQPRSNEKWVPAKKATEIANRLADTSKTWSFWDRFCLDNDVQTRDGTTKKGEPTKHRPEVEVGSLARALIEHCAKIKKATPEIQVYQQAIKQRVKEQFGWDEEELRQFAESD